MELHPSVVYEWQQDHLLSRRSLTWVHDHAEPGDANPVVTAVDQLRATAPL